MINIIRNLIFNIIRKLDTTLLIGKKGVKQNQKKNFKKNHKKLIVKVKKYISNKILILVNLREKIVIN